jgi:hypothetical protein
VSTDSWLSPAVLARLKDRKETTAPSLRLIVERDLAALDNSRCGRNAEVPSLPSTAGEPDMGNPITPGDPDDDVDPDDCAPSLPTMPSSWWTHVVLDPDETLVSREDVELVFSFIDRRLGGQQVTRSPLPPSPDGHRERLTPAEDGSSTPVLSSALPDSGKDAVQNCRDACASNRHIHNADSPGPVRDIDRKTWNEKLDFIATIGTLHQAIEEAFGSAGWTALMQCWHEMAGIEQPHRRTIRRDSEITDRIPVVHASTTDTSILSAPAPLEVEVLQSLPPRVRWFWLREDFVPPPWRYVETEGERAHRETMQEQGAWAG